MYKLYLVAFGIGIGCMASSGAVADERQQQLRYLLKHDCGSCHGLTLKGGLGPSLRPEDLAGKTDDMLVAAILHGRPGTTMAPWKALLSEEDARSLVMLIRGGGVK